MGVVQEKTKLEVMLFDRNITVKRLGEVIGVKQPKTAGLKLHRVVAFTLPEMRAVQKELFPNMTLEEIFEGYGE